MDVFGWRDVSVIRNLADFPGALDFKSRAREAVGAGITANGFQGFNVRVGLGAGQAFAVRKIAKRFPQAVQRTEVEIAVAPLQHAQGFEVVVFETINDFRFKSICIGCDTKCAIIHVAPRAACDLAEF